MLVMAMLVVLGRSDQEGYSDLSFQMQQIESKQGLEPGYTSRESRLKTGERVKKQQGDLKLFVLIISQAFVQPPIVSQR